MEHYADILELDYITDSTVDEACYNDVTRTWTVYIKAHHGQRTLKASHVVFATGLFGPAPNIPDIPSKESYKGLTYYSSAHMTASDVPDVHKKSVVIVGCGTSAHDIAQDFVNHGAKSVSMIQRSPIWSVSAESIANIQFRDWNRPAVSTQEADHLGMSWPLAITRAFGVEWTQAMVQNDAELMSDLEKAGVRLKRNRHDASLIDHQLLLGGHYYIDHGADHMIIDGKIRVHWCESGVQEYYADVIALGDGTRVPADIVILATGFQFHNEYLERLLGKDVVDKTGHVGMPNEDQEATGVSSICTDPLARVC